MNPLKKVLKRLSKKYVFKYNLVTSKIYYKKKKSNKYIEINDFILNSLFVENKKEIKGLSLVDFTTALKSDLCTPYNPFEEYFNNLPQWDGNTDYIKQLSDTVTIDRKRHWEKFFKKWIVSVVACVLSEDKVNHQTLIFVGKQGVGKTTWLNKLLPKELKQYIYMGVINNSKDAQIHLSECMFINIDEFETIGKKGLNQLKSIITQNHIRIRRPYGRISESLMRRASFMASVNDSAFLTDTTGNRRFLVFETEHINYTHNIDLKKVYSQCLHLIKQGFEHNINGKEILKISKINERYRLRTFEEELLLQNFKVSHKAKGEILTTTQILQRINENSKTYMGNSSLITLGKALSKHKFLKGRTKKKQHGWWVKQISKPKKRNSNY